MKLFFSVVLFNKPFILNNMTVLKYNFELFSFCKARYFEKLYDNLEI